MPLKNPPGCTDSRDDMRYRRSLLCVLVLIVSLSVPLCGQWQRGDLSTSTHLHVSTMRRAHPPHIEGDHVVLSYRPDRPVRHVGVAFARDSFGTVRDMVRNRHDTFFYLFKPEPGTDEIVYKLVVDGLWMTDPLNGDSIEGMAGSRLSRYRFVDAFPERPESPVVSDTGTVRLIYRGETGRRVYVTGDFSHWDPFLYRLEETEPGLYRGSFSFPSGVHLYQFVVGGRPISDPLNPLTAVRADGSTVSVVRVE